MFRLIFSSYYKHHNVRGIVSYLAILSEKDVQDFEVKHFGQSLKSTKEELYPKLGEERNLSEMLNRLIIF